MKVGISQAIGTGFALGMGFSELGEKYTISTSFNLK